MRNEGATFLLAVQFLTRLPVRSEGIYTAERMAASVRYYPLVGCLVGSLMALVFSLALLVFSQLIAILLSIAAGVLITGGFHEDGLADTADGIGGGSTRERSLEIMRDSRLGAYGTLALVLALLLKIALLHEQGSGFIPTTLIAAHGLSRASSLIVVISSRYVRDEGTGKPVAQAMSKGSILTIFLTSILVICGCGYFGLALPAIALGLVGIVVGHCATRAVFEKKLGGYTGDTLGAVQQVSELGFYLGVVAWP